MCESCNISWFALIERIGENHLWLGAIHKERSHLGERGGGVNWSYGGYSGYSTVLTNIVSSEHCIVVTGEHSGYQLCMAPYDNSRNSLFSR